MSARRAKRASTRQRRATKLASNARQGLTLARLVQSSALSAHQIRTQQLEPMPASATPGTRPRVGVASPAFPENSSLMLEQDHARNVQPTSSPRSRVLSFATTVRRLRTPRLVLANASVMLATLGSMSPVLRVPLVPSKWHRDRDHALTVQPASTRPTLGLRSVPIAQDIRCRNPAHKRAIALRGTQGSMTIVLAAPRGPIRVPLAALCARTAKVVSIRPPRPPRHVKIAGQTRIQFRAAPFVCVFRAFLEMDHVQPAHRVNTKGTRGRRRAKIAHRACLPQAAACRSATLVLPTRILCLGAWPASAMPDLRVREMAVTPVSRGNTSPPPDQSPAHRAPPASTRQRVPRWNVKRVKRTLIL